MWRVSLCEGRDVVDQRGYRVAIVGATGIVGQTQLGILEDREFPVRELLPLASGRSAGQTVRFRGRVRGGYIPRRGKLMEVQAYFRGRWRTISTTRARRNGAWSFGYTFGATVGRVAYRFRALVPDESGYPFETGASRPVRVTVSG